MISAIDYINLVLKKKGWTRAEFARQINLVEEKIGDSRTTAQNVTNYLNGQHALRPKWLAKVEVALGLPTYTLINMVEPPSEPDAKRELANIVKKVREK